MGLGDAYTFVVPRQDRREAGAVDISVPLSTDQTRERPNERSLTEVLQDMGKIKHHCWAGTILGAALFFVLAVTGVIVSVPTQIDDQSRFRYEVVILGVEVFRYPDDGELYRMRPYPQAITARQHLIAATTIVGAIVGCGVAFALHRFLPRRAWTDGAE